MEEEVVATDTYRVSCFSILPVVTETCGVGKKGFFSPVT